MLRHGLPCSLLCRLKLRKPASVALLLTQPLQAHAHVFEHCGAAIVSTVSLHAERGSSNRIRCDTGSRLRLGPPPHPLGHGARCGCHGARQGVSSERLVSWAQASSRNQCCCTGAERGARPGLRAIREPGHGRQRPRAGFHTAAWPTHETAVRGGGAGLRDAAGTLFFAGAVKKSTESFRNGDAASPAWSLSSATPAGRPCAARCCSARLA